MHPLSKPGGRGMGWIALSPASINAWQVLERGVRQNNERAKYTLSSYMACIDLLFIVLRPTQEYFSYMETTPLPVKGCKIRPMLGAQGPWAGRDLYRATPAVTRGLGFSGLIRRTAPFSRLLRHTRGCGGSILPRILTGPPSVAFYDTQGDVKDLF